MYICNCVIHVSHNVVFAITVNCLYSCFFCFRALSTQQGGYVRATNLYYYYYYYPHKQETRGLDTIQATSFFPWWLLSTFCGKERFEKNPEIS